MLQFVTWHFFLDILRNPLISKGICEKVWIRPSRINARADGYALKNGPANHLAQSTALRTGSGTSWRLGLRIP